MKLKAAVLMGSDSDLPVMTETIQALKEFGVPFEVHVASAHRTPDFVREFVSQAESNGFGVIVAGAGGAAHLAGAVAAHTTLPVIGVPLEVSLGGLDALLATVQMPAGIPVATVAVGKPGARNAGILAAQILSLADPELRRKFSAFKKGMADKVRAKDQDLQGKTPNS